MASLLNALIGEYRVVELIGAGGMGQVYKAVHTHLDRVIAIKALSPELADGPALQRFYGEAGIQASLKHPGVAEYLGFYEYQGRPCIFMEYVDGETLAAIVRRRGALPLAEAVRILRDIAAVAANFHAQGVVHRDLKSNNVKVNSAGRVKILDFGIARHRRSERLTRLGAVIGTPDALAPEQIRGAPVTEATDVWQLGVMFYELLTGRLPFQAASEPETFAKILAADYRPAEVPAGLKRILARCLERDASRRYANAAELLAALRAWELAGEAAPRRRDWRVSLGGAAAAAVLIAIAMIAIAVGVRAWHRSPLPPPLPVPPAAIVSPADVKTVTVDTMDGAADVFRDGNRVGVTPYRIEARTGEKIELVLRRPGYRDLPLQFEATERRSYTYTMQRAIP
jgi:serine/threonine protein kinase